MTVGIVIVSHSAKVAEGTADMVRQMVGAMVPLAWCGGDGQGGLGSAVGAILSAIEAAWSEDGVAVLRFDDWGSVDLVLEQGASTERWMVAQDRIAVNGGTASREPMRLMVGSRSNGGASAYGVRITRIEKGGRVDN